MNTSSLSCLLEMNEMMEKKKNNIDILKGLFDGCKVVVVGLGHSVERYLDTDLFDSAYVIAVNNADEVLKDRVNMIYDIEPRPKVDWKHQYGVWTTLTYNNTEDADYYVDLYEEMGKFDFDEPRIAWAHSSIVGAFWLAVWMGFENIALVGADFCYGPNGEKYFWNRKDHIKGQWYAQVPDPTDANAPDKNIMRSRAINCIEHMARYASVVNDVEVINFSPYIEYKYMRNLGIKI